MLGCTVTLLHVDIRDNLSPAVDLTTTEHCFLHINIRLYGLLVGKGIFTVASLAK